MDSEHDNPSSTAAPALPAEPSAPAAPSSPAVLRFLSCRWRKGAEDGIPHHCTHRDVLPMAGKEGFSADSWCADCALYKAKRTPRKRDDQQQQGQQNQQQDDWRYRY